jgi:hypothetical protein
VIEIDGAQIAAFVDAIFRHADQGGWVSLRAFRDDVDGRPVKIEPVRLNGDLAVIAEAAGAAARRAARHRYPVVFCPPLATFDNRAKADERSLANGLALSVELDADPERARKRLEFLIGPATVVVASGGIWDSPEGEPQPKLHVHWRLREPTRTPEAHARLKKARAMATALVGGDASNKPVVHPIRWPGSVHRKGDPTLCQILAINPDAEIDLQDALSILFDIQPEFRKEKPSSSPGDGNHAGEDRETTELIRALLAGEDYHRTLLALSMRFLARGMAAEHVVLTLKGMMQAIPPERRDGATPGRWQARYADIPRTVRQGQRKLEEHEQAKPDPAAKTDDRPPLVMLDDCELDTEVFWTIEDVLPRCNMMMAYARGGSGKTYLGNSIALGIGTGQWFAHAAERGAVLICAFERPEDAEDRLAAMRQRLGYHNAPVALLKLGGMPLDTARADLIVKRVGELAAQTGLPVRAIEIDTVSAALGGRKEDDDGLGQLRMIGERIHAQTGALVIWIHHEGKGDCMGPRGHLALADGCMVWWHVEERENGSRVVHVAKANRGPDHVPLFAFKLIPFEAGRDRRGKSIQLCEVQQIDLEAALASPVRKRFGLPAGDQQPKLGARQKLLLRLLNKLFGRHPEGVERATLRSHFVLELSAERERDGKPALQPEAANTAFRQTLAALQARELITGEDFLCPAD